MGEGIVAGGITTHVGGAKAISWRPSLSLVAPGVFVLLWSSGFISAKYGLPYAEPFTFLFLRMALAAALVFGLAVVVGASFPRRAADYAHSAAVGVLLHVGYLGGVFYAIDHGMPAGLSSLVVGVQPILTAVMAQALLRERVTARQWAGLLLGFAGVGLVVQERVGASLDNPIQRGAFGAITVALLATTAGTLYQKRFVRTIDLTAGAAIQFCAAGIVLGVLSVSFESMEIEWSGRFAGALGWAVVVMSLGAVLLMLRLIREHSVSRISSLFYLVPPVTALLAYFLFDERLGLIALIGMGMVVAGVALVVARSPATPARG